MSSPKAPGPQPAPRASLVRPDFRAPGEQSLWEAMARPGAAYPSLTSAEECDIAIVGGGLAGVSLAHHLTEEAERPLVLEAASIGTGMSAKAAGIVAPQLTRHTPASVLRALGAEAGARYLRLLAESGRYVFDLIRRHEIDCAAEQGGFLSPIGSARGAARLAQALEQWSAFRSDLELLNARRTSELSGCRGYEAALLDKSGGGLDPLALARGLAELAVAGGARIFTHSPVRELRRIGQRWQLRTPEGLVNARRVVLCAHGHNGDLRRELARTVLPLHVFEVATQPLDETVRRKVLPHNHVLTDQEADVFSIRYGYGGRLITAHSAPLETSRAAIEAAVNKRLQDALPGFQPASLDYVWHGTAWMNSTLLPRIAQVDENLTAVQACNGRGIALNAIIGRELARWLTSPKRYTLSIPLERPRRIFGFALARHVPRLLMTAGLMRRRWSSYLARHEDAS